MLSKIYIRNYILIDELELDFANGLNIITGETGAGKSILINAIDIVLGGKAGKEVIKNQDEKAIIELTLLNKKQDIAQLFKQYGIDNTGEEIVISKEITLTGSRSKVNGSIVNLEFLKIFRELFIDIHSQHQTYAFLQPKHHIRLLDSYMKKMHGDMFSSYNNLYSEYTELKNEIAKLQQASQKTEDQIEFLKFQSEEIENAELVSVNEDEELNNELSVLENTEKLKEYTGNAYWTLNGDDASILEGLNQIKFLINKAVNMDNKLTSVEEELINGIETIKNVSSEIRDYSSSLENDTERINNIQERLYLLDKLKHKYGGTLENVIKFGETVKEELSGIEFSTQNIEELQNKCQQKEKELMDLARIISEKRKQCGEKLSSLIVEKLEKLELPKVRFDIKFEQIELNSDGIDKVEFMISTNISEDLKPIAKVASGGELSRIMLAIKTIFSQADNIETVIFDEIDTGISGKTSQSMADEIKELAQYMQIIMITHQAIIASKADKHFYVKKVQDDVTKVNIYVLEGENKLKGIAELAGGYITEESINFARTLINS